jgi:DNA recombination protein RmuC
VADDAARVVTLGRELQQRLIIFDEQLGDVGKGLERAVSSYNRAVGSLESRVLVSARKLGELGVEGGALEMPALVETTVREVTANSSASATAS